MNFPNTVDAKGILNPHIAAEKFQLTRHLPSSDLAYFVEWYWIIHWDLRDQEPHTQDVLPYPSVNLTIEANQSGVFGVVTGKFTRTLVDSGRVVAAKFRPAGFYPFVQTPISEFSGKVAPMASMFGNQGEVLESTILTTEDDEDALARIVMSSGTTAVPKPIGMSPRIIEHRITSGRRTLSSVPWDRVVTEEAIGDTRCLVHTGRTEVSVSSPRRVWARSSGAAWV